MGHNSDLKQALLDKSEILKQRSIKASTSLFDPTRGLMVGKSSTGALSTGGFSDIEWGNGYTEGNAWHHSFPPYALSTMIGLYGSKEKYLSKLKKILTVPGDFKFGSYREVSCI